MVYKIGNVSDLSTIPIASDKAKEILYHFARVLTTEYGGDRNVDTDDGGYILYALPGTSDDEIKERFDYTQNILEYGEAFEDVCYAVYILCHRFRLFGKNMIFMLFLILSTTFYPNFIVDS